MTTTHTPGPWRVMRRANQLGTRVALVVGRANQPITEPRNFNDANLIAAAPDLLAALKLAYRHLNGGSDSLTPMEHAEAHRLARAAIARATNA